MCVYISTCTSLDMSQLLLCVSEWMRDQHYLLKWFQRQLEPYRSRIKVLDMTSSWRNGVALCALIHHYRPELMYVSGVRCQVSCVMCHVSASFVLCSLCIRTYVFAPLKNIHIFCTLRLQTPPQKLLCVSVNLKSVICI